MSLVLMSSCTYVGNIQDENTLHGTTMLKNDNDVYYYDKSDDGKIGLFCYNSETDKASEIDSFWYYGDLYFINEKLYYACGDDYTSFYIHSYDGQNIINEGIVYDNLHMASGRRTFSSECKIFMLNHKLGVLYNNRIYLKNNDTFDMISDDISSFCIEDDEIYYADNTGAIHLNDNVIISSNQIKEIDFVKYITSDSYCITNLMKEKEYLYFLVAEKETKLGKCFRVSTLTKKLESVAENDTISRFTIDDGKVYYYDIGTHKLICFDEDKKRTEINISNKIFGFDVFDGVIYYSTIGSDRKSFVYFDLLNGVEHNLMYKDVNGTVPLTPNKNTRLEED